MKLSKKLLAGSMALMLSLGNLHAMEGQNPANLRNGTTNTVAQHLRPRYQFYVSHQEAYDLWRNGLINNPYANIGMLRENNGRVFVMHREHNSSTNVIDFVNIIKDRFEYYTQGSDLSDEGIKKIVKPFVNFIGDMLRVRGICQLTNRDLDGIDWIYNTIGDVLEDSINSHNSNEIHFNLPDLNSNDDIYYDFCVAYGQQLFLLPFEIGTRRICIDELKNMLSHLLTNIGVLTILLPSTDNDSVHCFHLTGLDVESGFCTCVGNDGIEYSTHINTLAKTLENEQLTFLNICYLDKIPKRNRLLVKYSDGEDLFWDSSL